jgi:hypothetical protein
MCLKMPPQRAMKTTKEVIDLSKPREQFDSRKYAVGGTFESVSDMLEDFADHFTMQAKNYYALNSKYKSLFNHIIECFAQKNDIKVLNIEVQKTGYNTNESIHYDKVPRECMRLIAVVKERGFSELNLVLQGRNVPIRITSDGLYALPQQMSELSISFGNTLSDSRVKACKATYINFIVECLTDAPRAAVANDFAGIEMRSGNRKAIDKVAEMMSEKQVGDLVKGVAEMADKEEKEE